MSRAREAAGQTLIVMVGRVIGVFIAIGAVSFQTRYLSQSEFALVNIITLLTELCTVMGDFGLGLAMERRLPALLESDLREADALKGTFGYTVLLTTGCFSLLVWLFAPQVNRFLLKDTLDPALIPLTIPAILVGAWRNHLFSLMRGTRSFARLSVFSLTYQLFWVSCSIVCFLIWGIRGLVIGLAAGPMLPCLLETWLMRRHFTAPPTPAAYARHVRWTLPFWAERFVNFGYVYADQWIVAAMLSPAAFALYMVPRRLFDQLTSVLDGLWVVPTNVLSRESVRGPDILARSVGSFKRVFLYVFTPISAALLVSGYFVLDALSNGRYVGAAGAFSIMALFFFVNGVFAPQAISVSVMSPPKHRLASLVVQNVSFLAIVPVLATYLGIEGAAIARVLGAIIMAYMSCHFLRKVVVAPVDTAAIRVVLWPALALIVLAVVPQLVAYQRWLAPAYLALAGLTYVWLFVRRAEEQDLNLLEHMLPQRLKWAAHACRRLRPAVAPAV